MLQTLVSPVARQALTEEVVEAKARKGLSWQDLTEGTGLSLVFLTAALLGQHPSSKEAASWKHPGWFALGSNGLSILRNDPDLRNNAEIVGSRDVRGWHH